MIRTATQRTALALVAILAAGTAFAQTSPVSPPATVPGTVVSGGSPAGANSGPGSVSTLSREGTGAGTVSNNPAQAGNAANPALAVPNAGTTK